MIKRYFIEFARFSSRGTFTKLPTSVSQNDAPLAASVWLFELLKRSSGYYRGHNPDYSYHQNIRRTKDALPINEMIDWLDTQKIYYHYEFTYEQATSGIVLINPNTFDPDHEYWNYFKFSMRLYISADQIAIVKLYFPHIKFEIEHVDLG